MLFSVAPAEAGVQGHESVVGRPGCPLFAGMTTRGAGIIRLNFTTRQICRHLTA
jgi:hypothetical protein